MRKQKRLARSIVDEDRGINNFGITNTIQNIMRENQKRKKTRKESQRQEDEDKIIYREEKGMSATSQRSPLFEKRMRAKKKPILLVLY